MIDDHESPYEFPYDGCPRYDGPDPGRARPHDPDCCSDSDCPQRDYNRACILTLERLSQAYAAMHLLRSASSRLWNCDDEGHTVDCPRPECRFGMDMAVALDSNRRRFASSVRALCQVMTIPAADISGAWQEFVDVEQARVAVEQIASTTDADDRIAVRNVVRYIETWQRHAVGYDELEYHRWFKPPADTDASPN